MACNEMCTRPTRLIGDVVYRVGRTAHPSHHVKRDVEWVGNMTTGRRAKSQ